MRRHQPPERPSAAGIRIKSPRARFDRLSGRISGTRTDTPPSGSSPRRRKATQRGLSKRPRFPRIRGRFFAPEFPAVQKQHPLIPPGTARLLPTPSAPQVAIQSPRYRRLQFRARSASSRTKPAAPQVAPKPSAPQVATKPSAPQVAPSPQRLKSRQSPQRRRSDPVPLRRRSHQSPQNRRSDPVPRTAGRNTELVALPCSTCR